MAGSLRTGQIVWAEIADANGISKERPAVIVTPDERVTSTGSYRYFLELEISWQSPRKRCKKRRLLPPTKVEKTGIFQSTR